MTGEVWHQIMTFLLKLRSQKKLQKENKTCVDELLPTCTSTLLIVIFNRFADGVMDNKSHICLVNAHPKSHSGNNHLHKQTQTLHYMRVITKTANSSSVGATWIFLEDHRWCTRDLSEGSMLAWYGWARMFLFCRSVATASASFWENTYTIPANITYIVHFD